MAHSFTMYGVSYYSEDKEPVGRESHPSSVASTMYARPVFVQAESRLGLYKNDASIVRHKS